MSQPQNQEPAPQYLYYAPNEVLLYLEHSAPFAESPDTPVRSGLLGNLFAENDRLRGLLPGNFNGDLEALGFALPNTKQDFPFFTLFIVRADNLPAAAYLTHFNEVVGEQFAFNVSGIKIRLYKAALNWYSGAATHTAIGTSGSGKHARPVNNPDVLKHANYVFADDFEHALHGEKIGCGDHDVDVYLLDTLPPHDRISQAWAKWGTSGTGTLTDYTAILQGDYDPATRIYQTEQATYCYAEDHAFDQVNEPQNDPDGTTCAHEFVIHDRRKDPPVTAQTVDGHEPACFDPDEAKEYTTFDVSDHGLFIAGIVHKIAPAAQITVIESMNQYGVGTLWNILQGFRQVQKFRQAAARKGNYAIINCSLTLAFPTKGHDGYSPSPYDKGIFELNGVPTPAGVQNARGMVQNVTGNQQMLQALQVSIDETAALSSALFEQVRNAVQGNARILCASGNDSDRPNDVRPARYLAATLDPIGVGALQKDNLTPASYSNDADTPINNGYMVFGGDYDDSAKPCPPSNGAPVDYPDSGAGVISIYTSDFNVLDDQDQVCTIPNLNGFAEWAGTSFASPTLAGTMAQVCRVQGVTPDDALALFVNPFCPNDGVGTARRFPINRQ